MTVIPRRGHVRVEHRRVASCRLLYETRAILEPYATRLACAAAARRTGTRWTPALARADAPGVTARGLIDIDRECHEIIWAAAGNRFLTDTLDMLYAQSDRLWHMYLADVADMGHAVAEHRTILDALRSGDADRAAALVEAHVRAFDEQIRRAVTSRLNSPLAGW